MARTSRVNLKNWFKKLLKPTESQFATLIDSFFHPDEDTLPMDKVEGLDDALQGLGDQIQNLPGGGATAAGTSVDKTNLVIDADNLQEFSEAVDLLLYPSIDPDYVAPTLAVALSVAALQKVGTELDFNVTTTFDPGEIQVNGVKQNDRAGSANQYTLAGPQIADTDNVTDNVVVKPVVDFVVPLGDTDFEARVAHDEGPQPKTSRGVDFGAPLASGSIPGAATFNKATLKGVFPLFGTVGAITPISEIATLYDMSTANNIVMVLAAESGGNKQAVGIPDEWISNRALVGIQVLNTLSGNYDYPGGSAASSLSFWTESDTTKDVNGDRDYKLYTHNGADRGSVTIRLIF